MRKRSEMKKLRESGSEEKPKPSAAERTGSLFGEESKTKPSETGDGTILCTECKTYNKLAEMTARPDGDYECTRCASPIDLSEEQRVRSRVEAKTETTEKPAEKKGTVVYDPSSSRVDVQPPKQEVMREAVYCGECATSVSEAQVNDKTLVILSCGHRKADVVDSPDKAKMMKPAAGAQMLSERIGFRVRTTWGSSMFRVAEFCTFHTTEIAMEFTVPPGTSVADAVRRARQDMKKLADEEFREKLAWYRECLGLIKG